jgi:hypothetical protein
MPCTRATNPANRWSAVWRVLQRPCHVIQDPAPKRMCRLTRKLGERASKRGTGPGRPRSSGGRPTGRRAGRHAAPHARERGQPPRLPFPPQPRRIAPGERRRRSSVERIPWPFASFATGEPVDRSSPKSGPRGRWPMIQLGLSDAPSLGSVATAPRCATRSRKTSDHLATHGSNQRNCAAPSKTTSD